MRNLFIVLLFAVLLITCHSQQMVSYVFNQSYKSSEFSILEADFKDQLQKYNVAITDMNQWNGNEFNTDSGYVMQRFISKQLDEKTMLIFIYTSIIQNDTTYQFKIRKEEL